MITEQTHRTVPEVAAEPDRRAFFQTTILGFGSLITAGLLVPAFRYLFSTPAKTIASRWISLGKLTDFAAAGEPRQAPFVRGIEDGWKTLRERSSAWVTVTPKGEPVAFLPACTHLGCAYHWDKGSNVFVCPCHGSTFGIDGTVQTGPATRALEQYQTRLEGGEILIGPPKSA